MNTLVCAACNKEETDWVKQIPGAFQDNGWLRSVDQTYRPHGRESHVYLDYLIGHYNELSPKDEVILCQGNPFNHCPDFIQQVDNPDYRYYGPVVECAPDGLPHCQWFNLHHWSEILKLPLRTEYKFVAGAQYRLRGSDIKKQSRDFYSAMFYLSKIPNNKSAYVYERLWPVIWELAL